MVRARALFETENYLTALQVLRNTPAKGASAETHAYLGAAYLHLHLYQAALREFQTASRGAPGRLDPWIGLAVVHMRLGDEAMALEGAQKAVRVDNRSTDAWLVLGRAHWFQRTFSEAETAALKVHELDPSNLSATELLLRIYFEQNDPEKFQKLLDDTPKPNRPIQDLAVQFAVRRGEFRRAWELRIGFERRGIESRILRSELALMREPDRTDLYPALIRDLVKAGRFKEAIAAGRAYRGNVAMDLEMGKAHWLAGDRDRAVEAWLKAAGGRTHKLSAKAGLAAITGQRSHWIEAFDAEWPERDYFILAQVEGAIQNPSPLIKALAYRYAGLFDAEFFNKSAQQALLVLDEDPQQFDALMTLVTSYVRLGRIDDALRYAQHGRDLYPGRAEVWSRLGEIALGKGEHDKAAESMETALRLDPDNPSYLYNVGWLLDQLDRDDDAARFYERAMSASPLSFEAMNNLALIEGSRGRQDRALRLLNRAVDANPENEAAYFNRANYHAERRAWRDALADYQRAQSLNPGNAFAAVESGRIQLEMGNTERAIESLNRALENDPNAYDAYVLMSEAYERMGRSHEASAALEEAKRIRPEAMPAEGESR
jgi:tetratricopeptide (TPR) repeat protein